MIYLASSTQSLQVVCLTNVSTTQADVTVCFYDVPKIQKLDFSDYLGGVYVTTTNNSTHITALPAPAANVTRNIESVALYNADTSSALSWFVKIDDAGTKKTLVRQSLASTQTLFYEDGAGWVKI